MASPAFELDNLGVAQDNIRVPIVLIRVVDETDDLGVQALVGCTTVVLVIRPVRPQRVPLEAVCPFGSDFPSHLVEFVAQAVGLPDRTVVDVDVDPAEIRVLA